MTKKRFGAAVLIAAATLAATVPAAAQRARCYGKVATITGTR